MKYLAIRHGKTDANRLNRAAFGAKGAPLNDLGINQAILLHDKLMSFGIDPASHNVAVSELARTCQTAEVAGFKHIVVNEILNEINTPNPSLTLQLVAKNEVPKQAIEAAKAIIMNPPKQQIWVTHGLVIIALQYVLGIASKDNFEPEYCEIREIEI